MDRRIILVLLLSVALFYLFTMNRTYRLPFNRSLDRRMIERKMKSSQYIAVIGSSGYIGSRLLQHLQGEKGWFVLGYDRTFVGQASHEIDTDDLHKFHVVMYLGGLTSRAACLSRPTEVDYENIGDIVKLTQRMLSSQLLIFASTSAIAEGSGLNMSTEDSHIQAHLLDLYSTSLLRREQALQNLSLTVRKIPQIVGLRFGTVIGLSSSQRIDLGHMGLICQAFINGKINITHPETNRAFLCMEDLLRAVTTLIKQSKQAQRFDLFHLQSFSASISSVANTIAWRTGAHIHSWDHPVNNDTAGFSLNTQKFTTTFNFVFQGNQNDIVTRLIDDVPRMCLGRQSRLEQNSTKCVVCGSTTMHSVLDLHTQPLANDFRTENSTAWERFPLRLVRCSKCHHTQLSHIVDRKYLFSHYLYQSGTSQSLKTYFAWLAEKVIDESERTSGTVPEIACNDGSQLNEFSTRGWKTYGVDPAKNLVEIARAQNHTIFAGFWGVNTFPDLPSSSALDAIVAQNVLAHVEDPVHFLRTCAAIMNERTKLYIQTSQCEMYQTGQFDTVYHEHVSFFTAHSFQTIASIVDLKIVNFEITPIHGRSCLVTFQRKDISNVSFVTALEKETVPSLAAALERERQLGMTDAWFYVKYQAQALAMRQWIVRQLSVLHDQGHTVVAYGAAAKGMVLLHFLLEVWDGSWNISYVVDDAPLKQNTFCPGTLIPVRPTGEFGKHDPSTPLTIIVFAWNFWEEISGKIRQETVNKGMKTIFIILPFPQQQLIKLDVNNNSILTQNSYHPLSWPLIFPSPRRPVLLVSHFYNEEVLLPYWIRHHASMFDMAILIDYNSTDKSLEIIRREAPQSWKIVSSRNGQFAAGPVDEEVKDYEKMFPRAWKIALNTPEFLVHFNLRQMLAETERSSNIKAFRFRSIMMTGNDSMPLQRFASLLKQRSQYTYLLKSTDEIEGVNVYSRYLHRYPYGQYTTGRHSIGPDTWEWASTGFLTKYQYTPWPEIMNRKLQIQARIPQDDINQGRGFQHIVSSQVLEGRVIGIRGNPQANLQDFLAINEGLQTIHRVWKEVIDP